MSNRLRIAPGASVLLLWLVAPACVRGEETSDRLRALVFSGKNNHDYKKTTPLLKEILEESGRFVVDVTEDPAGCDAATFAKYDVLVSNWTNWPEIKNREWGTDTEKAFLGFVRKGKGFALFHAASTPFQTWPEFQQIVGSTWKLGTTGHGRIHAFKITIADKSHPVTRGVPDFEIRDELWHGTQTHPDIHVLCTAFSSKESGGSGASECVALCTTFGKGRGFNLVLGHDVAAMRNLGWRTLMLRGVEWAAAGKVTVPIPPALSGKASAGEKPLTDLDADLEAAATYAFGQSRAPLARVAEWTRRAATDPASRRKLAGKMCVMLSGGALADVTVDCRKFLCAQLSLIGSAEEVPVLVSLLDDDALSLAARSALERIPGEESLTAMRGALDKYEGRILIGLINSLGRRRDARSVDAIAQFMTSGDVELAGAAIDALGKIGGPAAVKALSEVEAKLPAKLQPVWDSALLECAAGLAESSRTAEAVAIYSKMSAPNKPAHVRIAGFSGLVACGKEKADELLLTALTGKDPVLRSAAVRIIRAKTKASDRQRMVQLFSKALASADSVESKRALLGHLGGIYHVEAMQLALRYLKDSAAADEASRAVLDVAAHFGGAHKVEVLGALRRVRAANASPQVRRRVLGILLKTAKPGNLATGAKAASPDGLDKDGAAGGDQAGIDGDPQTYWDEVDDQKLYRFKVTFNQPTDVSAVSILSYRQHDYAPKDFEILCDDKVVKTVRGASYTDRELVVVFPETRCESLELKITGYYGRSPAIRELGVYSFRSLDAGGPEK